MASESAMNTWRVKKRVEERYSEHHGGSTSRRGSEQHDKLGIFKPYVKNREDTCFLKPNCELAPMKKSLIAEGSASHSGGNQN